MSIEIGGFFRIYCCFLAGILGAAFGSFLGCAADRMAAGESFLKGRSHCDSCGHPLGLLDLVPVLSWLMLRGKCRYCKARVPVRYPLTEAFMALMAVLCLLRFDISVLFLRNFAFGCCLLCLSLVDLEIYEIPDGCQIGAVLIWLAALPFLENRWSLVKSGLMAAMIFSGSILLLSLLMDRILGKESMGGGDIKLFFVCGLYLGMAGELFMVILACILGLLFMITTGKKKENGQFPFGPSIAAAAWIVLLYGQGLITWYLELIF